MDDVNHIFIFPVTIVSATREVCRWKKKRIQDISANDALLSSSEALSVWCFLLIPPKRNMLPKCGDSSGSFFSFPNTNYESYDLYEKSQVIAESKQNRYSSEFVWLLSFIFWMAGHGPNKRLFQFPWFRKNRSIQCYYCLWRNLCFKN